MPPESVSPHPASAFPAPIPAATVLVARDGPGGIEVLAAVRGQRVGFAPGALAFPGGVVDPGDWTLALALGQEDGLGPYRLAAVRELFEGTGLLLAAGRDGLAGEGLVHCRAALLRGEVGFAGLLAHLGVGLEL